MAVEGHMVVTLLFVWLLTDLHCCYVSSSSMLFHHTAVTALLTVNLLVYCTVSGLTECFISIDCPMIPDDD
jgi:hypothetical protein